jgi:hypothetical protein
MAGQHDRNLKWTEEDDILRQLPAGSFGASEFASQII